MKRNPLLKGDTCSVCHGAGNVISDTEVEQVVRCTECKGTGLVNSPNACTMCKGSGAVLVFAEGLNPEKFSFDMRCTHCNGEGLEPVALLLLHA
jgi:DnaJ-class molecular chaperone